MMKDEMNEEHDGWCGENGISADGCSQGLENWREWIPKCQEDSNTLHVIFYWKIMQNHAN